MEYKAGDKYYMLTLVKLVEKSNSGHLWLMRCDCGKEKVMRASAAKAGNRKSCGCFLRASKIKHGQSIPGKETSEYRTWKSMKSRCNSPSNKWFHRYGGRGIKICPEWNEDFNNFYRDMGDKPSKKHSLDRIDNDGDYTPENCRWATAAQQVRNCMSNRICTLLGEDMCVTDAIRTLAIRSSVTWHYINGRGMTPDEAIAEVARQDGVNIEDHRSKGTDEGF